MRNSLLEHERAHQAEDKDALLRMQGFIEGNPGRRFTTTSLAQLLGVNKSTVGRLLPFCTLYQTDHKGIFCSIAPKLEETTEGLEEVQQLRSMGWESICAIFDFFDLQKRRGHTKRLRATDRDRL